MKVHGNMVSEKGMRFKVMQKDSESSKTHGKEVKANKNWIESQMGSS